jgi:hypothetical protein
MLGKVTSSGAGLGLGGVGTQAGRECLPEIVKHW